MALRFVAPLLLLALPISMAAPLASPAQEQAPRQDKLRTDALGDPLPVGAVARLGSTRLLHPRQHFQLGYGISVTFSPDGRQFATVGWGDTLICFWDAATGKETRRVNVPTLSLNGVTGFSFSPDGALLAVEGRDIAPNDNLFVCEAATGKLKWQAAAHEWPTIATRFVDGGKTLVSVGHKGKVCWWDVAAGKKLRTWDAAVPWPAQKGKGRFNAYRSATLSPDGKTLAGYAYWLLKEKKQEEDPNGALVVLDLVTGKELWRSEALEQATFPVSFSPDGQRLTALDAGKGGPGIYETATGNLVKRLPLPPLASGGENNGRDIGSMEFAPDGKTVFAGINNFGVFQWDAATGKLLRKFRPQASLPWQGVIVVPSPDGRRVLAAVGQKMWLWDVATGKEIPGAVGHGDPVNYLQFTADGKELLSAERVQGYGVRGLVRWDARTWQPRECLDEQVLERTRLLPAVSPDFRLEVGRQDRTGDLVVRTCDTKKEVCRLDLKYQELHNVHGQLSPNNHLVVMGSLGRDQELMLLDATTGKRRCALDGEACMTCFAFSPDDRRVAWFDRYRTIHVIDVANGKTVQRMNSPVKRPEREVLAPVLMFSPDGRFLASWEVEDNDIHVWDLAKGKKLVCLPGNQEESKQDRVCLAFAPDGRTLAVGGRDGTHDVQVWELASGKVRLKLRGHRAPVTALTFSPNGRLLASGSEDTTVLIWELFAPLPK